MRVRFTEPAADDLESIFHYLDEHSPQGAQRVRRRLVSSINMLSTVPLAGTQTADPQIRRLSVNPFPYLVFYEVTPTEIIVHAVRHGARDPGSMPGE